MDAKFTITLAWSLLVLSSCFPVGENTVADNTPTPTTAGSGLAPESTVEILVTSARGDRIDRKANVPFQQGQARGTVITVLSDRTRQDIIGIGSSFTESSAFVLAHLDKVARRDVMEKLYGETGANFSLARTPIGATDFSVEGKYSYAAVAGDAELEAFSIEVDKDGFTRDEYPGIRDETYDLLPMIREAQAIKDGQQDQDLRIVASAWTAPPWMKDIEDWYVGGTPDNFGQGTGGNLKPEYLSVYADYLVRYLDAYRLEGVNIWGLTPVNEPEGNSGQWESMHFSPKSQSDFIKSHLGPALQAGGHGDSKLLIYDQNRDNLEHWTDVILGAPETAPHVYGTAIHWYSSTYKVHEDVLQRVHDKFPGFDIIHTEGTIDNLGLEAPGGIGDPAGYQESGWFDNDAFWWNESASDWAYTASWAPNPQDHPMYTPVHRYARNIIVSLDHWVSGWIDWNVVLDRHGGPNHVNNLCGAPVMIDTATGQVYYTPVYYVLAQFSRTIRPGDTVVESELRADGLDHDALHTVSTLNDTGLLSVQLLNTTRQPVGYKLQIGEQYAEIEIPANAVQTVRVQL